MESLRGRPEADVTFCRGSHPWRASESPGELAEAACQAPARVPDLVDLDRGPRAGITSQVTPPCCSGDTEHPCRGDAAVRRPDSPSRLRHSVSPQERPLLAPRECLPQAHQPSRGAHIGRPAPEGSCVGEITSRRQTRKQLCEEISVDKGTRFGNGEVISAGRAQGEGLFTRKDPRCLGSWLRPTDGFTLPAGVAAVSSPALPAPQRPTPPVPSGHERGLSSA
ncbi:unnamed protein product [Rangifer tarandus platyrhynchus]|uniref:Uncharacterized protein n=2 Tax=Rangifer tarandus platyrhynchus TaxID=3082113 RepID=A0ABN8YPQ2_RANTA|nr:unnamed protein product [Rangifer tarandus platyrhynchus]CAI9701509.1 unnamed protein product [Rangifer tarandus platyrhynchus]